MSFNAAKSPFSWVLVLLCLAATPVVAQYSTTPLFSNQIKPGGTASSAFATPVSGTTYTSTNRPTEAVSGRFKIDNWSAGMAFASSPPNYNFGDVIVPPPLTDLSVAPTVSTVNGAFYMVSTKQLIAAQAGPCTVTWRLTDGTSKTVTYTLGAMPTLSPSRLFWTDNYITGAPLNTNYNSLPDNTDYAVSLSGIYAKIHYNSVVTDFDLVNSQDNPAGRGARSDNAVSHLSLPAIWVDRNSVLRARSMTGYFIIEYFDSSNYDRSAGYEVVYVAPAHVYQSSLVLGDRLLPSEGATVAAGLVPSTTKAGDYVTQWSASGSHFLDWLFATSVNSDSGHPTGNPSKTQVLWQRKGNLQIMWPYEPHWYSITWPGDHSAKLFVFDASNPSGSPTATIPTNFTATVVWAEKTDAILKADSASSVISAVGEGRALVQYQNNTDVWFVAVRVAARTNGAYVSNQEIFWPVGQPLQPVSNPPRLQFDGTGNYLSFYSALQSGLTTELWIKANAVTNNQSLAGFLDYPQQAFVQAVLSLTNSFLRLSVLTNGTASSLAITSTNSLQAGVWSHVAFTKSASGQLQLYVNGIADSTAATTIFNAQSPGIATYSQVEIGAGFPVNGAVGSTLASFAGEIREVRIWDTTVSSATIRQNMSANLTGGELSLAHLINLVWQEGNTPYQGLGGPTFLVLDSATGTFVSGYGTPNTSGQVPFQLDRRLSLDGANNWAEVPLSWNLNDNKTVEFWFNSGSGTSARSLFAAIAGTSTNLSVGLSGGRLTMTTSGTTSLNGGTLVYENSSHHVAVTVQGQGILREVYSNIGGGALSDLTNNSAYPDHPSATTVVTTGFEAPTDIADNYGQRMRGYITAPVSGAYKFWISSDDQSGLFLSTNSDPANKRLIASVNAWTASREWTKETNQQSAQISLVGGQKYYIEALEKEGGGGDNLAVRWLRPDGVDEGPIPGAYLAPYIQTSIYLDGVLQGSLTLPGSGSSPVASKLLVGAGFPSAGYGKFLGEIRDFRVYSAARSQAQVSADMTSVANLADPDLIRFYNFDQVSPATVAGEALLQLPDQARAYSASYHGAATLGSALSTAPPTELSGGIIISGHAYHDGIYSSEGRIIPVNDNSSDSLIEVWWKNSFTASYLDQPIDFPGTVTRYRLMDPMAVPTLIIAGQNTSGFLVPSTWAEPTIYYQNDSSVVGFNPNEEHALLLGSSVFATRWDLNLDTTSRGFVLLEYKDSERDSLSYIQPLKVVATNAVYPTFDSGLEVGHLLQAPTPLVDLPKSVLSGPLAGADPQHRLYQDRRYDWWAKSASSTTNLDSVPARWYYPLQPGFYWPASLGTKSPGDPVPFGNTSNGLAINYTLAWPAIVPHLALGQTLSDGVPSAVGDGNLPAVTGQKSVEILFDEANYSSKSSAVVLDPSTSSTADLSSLNGVNTATDVELGLTYFTLLPPHLRERVSWDPMAKKLTLTGSIVRPVTGFPYVLPAWLGSAGNTNTDYSVLAGLSSASSWQTAVNALRKQATLIPNAETPFTSLVLAPSGTAGGHVTLGMATRTNLNNSGDPVSLYPIFVDTNALYTGTILVMYSANKFDQYTTLRHSADFGGDPSQYQLEWRYSFPVDGQTPTSSPDTWIVYSPATTGLNRIIFGGPGILTLKDVYFSCHWKCITPGAPNTAWSAWTPPALVESWLTRAMDGINPFEQRVESLANNHLDLTTSILSQAGKRFVGAIPLNMDNADSFGLIETYETLLQQARNLSIDAGYSDDDVNASLLNSASKLNELYTMLGDEALTDAKDPTIAWGTLDLNDVFFGSRASSLFAFQGIVPTLLEEELALLRGLDNTTSTPVTTYPVYNRLYWNFTKGINSGEPAYALNYNITSLVENENGSITEADAAKLYPQGHGDAYGHYLTALMNYYRLLANTNFTWYPRAEVKTIGGVNVTFDYVDERKMAASSLQRARAAYEIVHRTFSRDFTFDANQRGKLYADSDPSRAWSATEWTDRASQGVLYDWIVLNSLLPAPQQSDTPQSISRATVPELGQLSGFIRTLQEEQDDMDRGDSPMGVSASIVPFDLDPVQLDAGQSHFEQVYARATGAMQTAYTVLQRASVAATNLRRQDVSLEAFRDQINQRENEFNHQLVDLYGTPYADDIGPTGTFAQGYTGADLYHYNYIDRDLFNPADAGAVTEATFTSQYSITGDSMDTLSTVSAQVTYSINSNGIPVLPDAWTGQRSVYGKIQSALGDYIRAWVSLRGSLAHQGDLVNQVEARLQRLRDHNAYSASYGAIGDRLAQQQSAADKLQELADNVVAFLEEEKAAAEEVANATEEALPTSVIVGLADGGDLSFPARIGIGIGKVAEFLGFTSAQGIAQLSSYAAGKVSSNLGDQMVANDSALQDAEYQSQTALETTILLSQVNAAKDSVYASAVAFRQSWQAYVSLVAKGNQLQADLLAFRQINASHIQQDRYADIVFRTFKNEDLEQYLNAFDQAARYTFAAARVYDYETGLLDPTVVSGREGDFMGEIMQARQLGDMVAGQPVLGTTSAQTLASILARMRANWTVLEGRFGINNPTLESHKISLRQELFRIGHSTDPVTETNNVAAWQNKLYSYKVSDIRQIAEFKNFCQLYSPMATSEPALVIPFSTEITAGKNVFGLPLAGGDTAFDPAHFTTKIRGATLSLVNYNAGVGAVLTKSPRAYLVPVGTDRQRTPLSGGIDVRDWHVLDQVMPMPYPSASGDIDLVLGSIGTDNVHTIRRFPPMRAYDDASLSTSANIPYDARLVGRSVWNTQWVLIIPGSGLSASSSTALDSFIQGVTDINLLLETYSYSGN